MLSKNANLVNRITYIYLARMLTTCKSMYAEGVFLDMCVPHVHVHQCLAKGLIMCIRSGYMRNWDEGWGKHPRTCETLQVDMSGISDPHGG